MKRYSAILLLLAASMLVTMSSPAQNSGQRLELDRKGETIVLEPYAPNIIRVTLSLQKEPALAAPGYGLIASPDAAGWSASQTEKADEYKSSQMIVTVDRERPAGPPPLRTMTDIGKYFGGSTPGAHITLRTPEGKKLLEMTGWSEAVPNHKDGTAPLLNDRRPSDPDFYVVGATFASPVDEHYYGLGDNQEGFLDHRGHAVYCWQNYTSPAGAHYVRTVLSDEQRVWTGVGQPVEDDH